MIYDYKFMIKVLTNISSVKRGQLIFNLIKNYLNTEKVRLEQMQDQIMFVFQNNEQQVEKAQMLMQEVGVKSKVI